MLQMGTHPMMLVIMSKIVTTLLLKSKKKCQQLFQGGAFPRLIWPMDQVQIRLFFELQVRVCKRADLFKADLGESHGAFLFCK
jgi:hypothetical protein